MSAAPGAAVRAAADAPYRRRPRVRRTARDRAVRGAAYLLVLAVAGGATLGGLRSQADAEQRVRDGFAARASLSAGFVSTYTRQLLDREHTVASGILSGPDVSRFDEVTQAFGFQAAVLLAADGTLLAVAPATPQLVGHPVGQKYAHLRQALRGVPAVSGVVPSAAQGEPVIAFAAPYDTATGRRVLSGAHLVRDTPLQEYLTGMSATEGFRAYVVDDEGAVVAGSGPSRGRVTTLEQEAPATAQALRVAAAAVDATGRWVTATPIAGTPWRLVTSVPERTLLQPVRGRIGLQYAGLVLLTVIGLIACWLGLRLRDERRELERANTRLEDLAHLDGLTGLSNRRRLDERLLIEHERCRRDQDWLSVLVVDVDHFKRVNDTFGHAVGDGILREVAARLACCVREQDVAGRWGGEEFLVVLPRTSVDVAGVIAERIRLAVASRAFVAGTGGDLLDVTVSIGCYGDTTSHPDVLVNVADRALYAAKGTGRNRVVTRRRPAPLRPAAGVVTAR